MLEVVLVILLVLAFLMVAYKGAVHEFQILQKDWKPTIDWSALLAEKLPLVIRNVESSWQGSWTRMATAAKSWPIQVRKDGVLFKSRWNQWIASPPGEPPLTSETLEEITQYVDIPLTAWSDGGFHRWSWIPAHLTRATCQILGPAAVRGVQLTTAAATLLQSTDGAPLQIWIAHEGAVPATVAPALVGKDPWSLQDDEIPWISEVKFVEIRLRPGNALVIPTHWYWAARPLGDDVGSMGDGSWFWTAEFQSPISWVVSKVRNSAKNESC